ncbi:MAG: helix-turn-helix domain-containing protein [Ruminiclostridium sp.]|nr:helix-turn-helix domain-containing protein [Ruminiclostridium sp.]
MKITLDKNLRELRLAAEMTQEQLAESLLVSPQTVSRWETGVSYPDLGLLPTIAAIFEVSVDELLGVDHAGKREQVEKILHESKRFNNEGKFKERIAFLREKLAEFPNNTELMLDLADALFDVRSEEANREALVLCQKVDGKAKLLAQNYSCKQLMAFLYKRLGDEESAVKIVNDELPSLWVSREVIAPKVYPWQTAQAQRQGNLLLFADLLFQTFMNLSRWIGSTEQNIEMAEKAVQIFYIVAGENADFYNERISTGYLRMAELYAELGDAEKTLENLEKAADYAERYENRPEKYDVYWLSLTVVNKK